MSMSDTFETHFFDDEGDDGFASSDDEGVSFTVGVTGGGARVEFHTRNKPGVQQRPVVTDRPKPDYKVKCRAVAFIHGSMGGGRRGEKATLMVFDFRFVRRNKRARIKAARLEFEFRSKEGAEDSEGYQVCKIVPNEPVPMLQTTQMVKITKGADATAGAGAFGAEASAGVHYTSTTETEETDRIEITGDIDASDFGIENKVTFTINENAMHKTGIPAHVRVAMLLKRPDDELFHCVPRFDIDTDLRSAIKDWFSREEPDDPVEMNPAKEPYNELEGIEIDAENLDAVDLDQLFEMRYSAKTTVRGDEKGAVEADVTQVKKTMVMAAAGN